MALKHLKSDEMIQITSTWLDPQSPAHQAIVLVADLAGLLPRVDAAHTGLSTAMQPVVNPLLAQLIEQEGKIDIRHDAVIRGVWWFLTGMAELLGGDAAVAILALRDTLLPDGLSSQLKTYRGEAGQAEQLSKRLTPAIKQQLDGILVGSAPGPVPLTQYIDELINLGGQLGDLEDKKAEIQDKPAVSAAQAEQNARNLWIRVANAFVANGELAGLDEATDALIFAPLRAAEKTADKRAREEKAAAEAKAKAEAEAKAKAEAEAKAKAKAEAEAAAAAQGTGQGGSGPSKGTP